MENKLTTEAFEGNGNAVIYARYSSSSQQEQSIDGQLRYCYQYAAARGYRVVGEYIDRAMSGTSADRRAEFQRMIADSKKGQFQAVLVWKLDRFSRNRYDSIIYKTKLKNNGVHVLSVTEGIGEGSESNIMFPINNTGKVILYNVMVKFEADSIAPSENYVGNIKPGDTGNVDAMVNGIAATMDEGKVKIIITYEDENGEVQDPVEKELSLYVTEMAEEDFGDMDASMFEDIPMEPASPLQKYLKIILPLGAVAAVAVVVVVVMIIRKKKKAAKEEDIDDEIS